MIKTQKQLKFSDIFLLKGKMELSLIQPDSAPQNDPEFKNGLMNENKNIARVNFILA